MATKKATEIAVINERPTFLATREEGPVGIKELSQYIVPPRLKVVQKQSGGAFLENFNPGDVIAVPARVMVSPVEINPQGRPTNDGTPFYFVPIFFFVEWCTWNPIETKGTLNAIRYRTLDPRDPIASKAKNPDKWTEEIEGIECRHIEHLNFLVMLADPDHALYDTPLVLSFAKSEHRIGSNFCALLRMRKADIFGCQFAGKVAGRNNGKGEWHGVDVFNPPGDSGYSQWVADEDRYKFLGGLHKEYADHHAKTLIRPDYEDPAEDEAAPSNQF